MRLTRIDDPRDNLERADRDQLFRFAKSRGVAEIDDRLYNGGNAANLMRMILRAKGLTNINVPYQQLGMPPQTAIEQPSGQPAVMLDDVLKEQLKASLAKPKEEPKKPIADMTIGELRKAVKAAGITAQRTDNMKVLREKLIGSKAAT